MRLYNPAGRYWDTRDPKNIKFSLGSWTSACRMGLLFDQLAYYFETHKA